MQHKNAVRARLYEHFFDVRDRLNTTRTMQGVARIPDVLCPRCLTTRGIVRITSSPMSF
jgi:hypothetical protein